MVGTGLNLLWLERAHFLQNERGCLFKMKFFRHKKVRLALNSYSQSGESSLPRPC
jgi:hypothetical protein